jgi:hypothetical protein
VGRCGLDACGSGQGPEGALLNMEMNLWVSLKVRNF